MTAGSILPIFLQDIPEAHAMARRELLFGWGQNAAGQLGEGGDAHRLSPVNVPLTPAMIAEGVRNWGEVEFFTGDGHTFVRTSSGALFGWGENFAGQLALNHMDPVRVPTPIPLPAVFSNAGANDWNDVRLLPKAQHNFAFTPNGAMFSWGRNVWGQLGDGSTSDSATPTLVPVTPQVAMMGVTSWSNVEFLSDTSHLNIVRTPNGNLIRWGPGTGSLPPFQQTPQLLALTPAMISPGGATTWNDVDVFVGGIQAFARTPNGQLFAWGSNSFGNLGNGNNTNQTGIVQVSLPAGLSNWNGVEIMPSWEHTFARTSNGNLFGWGRNNLGELGDGTIIDRHTPVPLTLPAIVAAAPGVSNWSDVEFLRGNHYTFLRTYYGQLFGWGLNAGGQLGDGTGTNQPNPVELELTQAMEDAGAETWNDIEIFTRSHYTLARVLGDNPVMPLSKTLRLNEGTIVPGTNVPNAPPGRVSGPATFTFEFTPRNAVRINDDPIRYSETGVPAIANQTITIDPTTATAPDANGVFTATGDDINIWELVETALGTGRTGGTFVWELRELSPTTTPPSSSTLHNPPQVHVVYDESRFQIRAHIDRLGNLFALEIFEMEQVGQNWQIVLPKLREADFTNTYTRMVGDSQRAALYINKDVVGDMANLSLPFTFTLTLTNPHLTPPNIGSITASVITGSPPTQVRTYPITASTSTFTLAHGETLRILELPAGTRFQVTEHARAQFMPEATVAAIPVPPATGTYAQLGADTPLPTGTYIIHQVDLNRANFINTYLWDVPAGLLITSTPWAALGVVALLLALLAVTRNRKRIEELPLVI